MKTSPTYFLKIEEEYCYVLLPTSLPTQDIRKLIYKGKETKLLFDKLHGH